MPVEKFEKPPAVLEEKIGNEQFAEWYSLNFQVQMSTAIRKTLDLSQRERKLMLEVRKRIPEVTAAELENLRHSSLERILGNIKTFEDNTLDPHDFVHVLGANPPNVKGNVENLISRNFRVKIFISILPRKPKFVEEDMEILEGRGVDIASFESKSKIGINPKTFVEFLESPLKKRVMYHSLCDKGEFKQSIENLGMTDERQAMAKILEEFEKREKEGKAEMSNDEMWEIFKTYSTSSRDRMNNIAMVFVKDGGLGRSEERSMEKRRY